MLSFIVKGSGDEKKTVFKGGDGTVSHRAVPSRILALIAGIPAKAAVACAAGVLHFAPLPGGISPAALAFAAGVPDTYALPALIGFFVGGWLAGDAVSPLYLSAGGVVAAVRLIVSGRKKKTFAASVAAASGALVFTKAASLVLVGSFSLSALLIVAAEAAAVVVLARFFRESFTAIREERSAAASLIGAYCLASEQAIGLSVFLSAAILISEPTFYFAAAAITVGTAAASVFGEYSKMACFFPYFALLAAFSAAAPQNLFGLTFICESAIACGLFVVLPLKPRHERRRRAAAGENTGARPVYRNLCSVSAALTDAAKMIGSSCTVSAAVKSTEDLVNGVAGEVCRKCGRMQSCWVDNYNDTTEDFALLLRTADVKGRIAPSDFSKRLFRRCIQSQELATVFNRYYRGGKTRLAADKNVRLYKKQMVGELQMMSEVARRAALCAYPNKEADVELSNAVAAAATRAGIPLIGITITVCESGSASASADFYADLRTKQRIELERVLAKATGMQFSPDEGCCSPRRVIFRRDTELQLSVSEWKRGKSGISGDIWSGFTTYMGLSYVMLADGMGTGSDAAADSAAVCSVARRLLEAGCSGERAASLVNSMLAIRDSAEAALSLDILEVNMFTGALKLFKAGGAPSYLYSKGKVTAFAAPSLPIGIMDELCCRKAEGAVGVGDRAALVSDGAVSAFGESLPRILAEEQFDCDRVRRRLGRESASVNLSDDATVLIITVTA